MDEVGQPGVVQPGTGDGSRDDATGSRAVAGDLAGSESSPGDPAWPDGDPLGMAWPAAGRVSGRATSDWYEQATARNSHDRYPTSGGERYPSEGSGGHVRGPGDRHPSDPHGFAPLRPQPDPYARPEPSAGPEPRPESPSHAAPGADTDAWRAPDGNRYWSRTSTGPARGSVPLTDALTAETIEAPLLAAAAARPYGEPVSAAIRLPQVFVPRPRAGDSYGRQSGDVPRVPNDWDNAKPAPDVDPEAKSAPRPASAVPAPGYPDAPYARASAAVPVSPVRPDVPAAPSVVAERRSVPEAASPSNVGSSISDGAVVAGLAGIPAQARPASSSPVVATSNASDGPAATDRANAAQHEAAGDPDRSSQHGGSDQRAAAREPDGQAADRSAERQRPAAIPMPGRPSGPTDVPPPPATGSGGNAVPEGVGARLLDGESGAAAQADASEDVPPIFRQTANPHPADPPHPPSSVPSGESDASRQSGEMPGWSPTREVRNRRGPWLRGAGSIRSGRFGGRPMSMFSSSSYDDDRRRDPDAPAVPADAADVAGPDAGASAPTIAMRPATYTAPPDVAAAEPRRDGPPEPDKSWYVNEPVPPARPATAEPPGAAEHDWDDGHRFTLVNQPILPHRVPAKPDVPFADTGELDDFDDVVDEVADLPTPDLDGPELSRIASRLRHDEESVPELPDELDVAAVLAAVRQVNGVRSAQLRPNPGGVHILRLDLADDADAGRVSRQVARLLKERMGLAAEPRRSRTTPGAPGDAGTNGTPAERTALAPPSRPNTPSRPTGATRPSTTGESAAGASPGTTPPPVPTARAGSSEATERGGSPGLAMQSGATPGTAVSADSDGRAVAAVQSTPAAKTRSAEMRSAAPTYPAATDPESRRDQLGGPTVAGAPGFRPTMPGEPGAFLPAMATVPAAAPLAPVPGQPPRIVIDQVRVSTLGTEATVEVRLHFGTVATVGKATGPAVDAYLLRLAAQAAAGAIDSLITAADIGRRSAASSGSDARPPSGSPGAARPSTGPMRCYIEHAGVVPFGSSVVAVVVVLVSGDGRVEQLVGSALVAGDPRHSIVRATLAAVNRRLESLLT